MDIKHLIGNPIFAIETNVDYLRRRCMDFSSPPCSPLEVAKVLDEILASVERIKSVLIDNEASELYRSEAKIKPLGLQRKDRRMWLGYAESGGGKQWVEAEIAGPWPDDLKRDDKVEIVVQRLKS